MIIDEVTVDKTSKEHERLLHYCSIDTFRQILKNKTLKCNSLKNVNDKLEHQRTGVEKFAASTYVSCFCNYQNEMVPFWYMYGNCSNQEKVLLKLSNFSDCFSEIFNPDYFYDENGRKMSFNRNSCECGEILSFKIEVTDVEYRPSDDSVFKKNYCVEGVGKIAITNSNDDVCNRPLNKYVIGELGKYKTNPWGYEKETRIILRASPIANFESSNSIGNNHIFLAISDDFFHNLEVILNPWADIEFEQQVKRTIDSSLINESIKESIKISHSDLTDQITTEFFLKRRTLRTSNKSHSK